jgi:hypothetical protein
VKKISAVQNEEARIAKKFVLKIGQLKEREQSQIDEINELQVNCCLVIKSFFFMEKN